MAASVSSINGHALSGAVSQTGNNTQAEQNLYYFFPPMAAGFTAQGTVSLSYGSLPPGARVQFLARAGMIACSGGNAAPTVSITSPAANATFTAPASIALTANAQDSDGTVTQVQYFANASPIGTATTSPYSFNWTNVAAGAYSLTAVATDNSGATTTSAPVSITVGAAQAKLYFIHTDHLNTPRLISDDQQRTVWRWDNTDPFGGNPPDENPSGLGTFEFPLRFPGQYFDRETNLHYNYFRDYDASLARYGESDPIGLAAGLNTYAYGSGRPLSVSDPLGLQTQALSPLCGPYFPLCLGAATLATGLGIQATINAINNSSSGNGNPPSNAPSPQGSASGDYCIQNPNDPICQPQGGMQPQQCSIDPSRLPHIFRDAPGHMPNTPANQQLLVKVASNPRNFLGVDQYGNAWYAQIQPNGTQVWASVRNNVVQNGSLNLAPRTFNPQTGLAKP